MISKPGLSSFLSRSDEAEDEEGVAGVVGEAGIGEFGNEEVRGEAGIVGG